MAFNEFEFERTTPESLGISSKAILSFIGDIDQDFTEMHGFMLARHGRVCAEGWWAPYAPGLRLMNASLTKTYTATAVGIAYTEGLLSLDDRIIDYFPELIPENSSDNLKELRLRDTLSMTNGMEQQGRPTINWIKEFLAMPVVHKPGSRFLYNNNGSTLLAAIVRKISGESLHDYLKTRLFDKLGIRADNLKWFYMPDGCEIGGGGLHSTTEDNLRLAQLLLTGVWRGERIIAADYIKEMGTNHIPKLPDGTYSGNADPNFCGYGYQTWLCPFDGAFRADGAGGQFAMVFPHCDAVLSLHESAPFGGGDQKVREAIWKLVKTFSESPLPENPEALAALKTRLSRLAIKAPGYARISPLTQKISGNTYRTVEGVYSFAETGKHFMSGTELAPGITEITFNLTQSSCLIDFTEGGERYHVQLGLDGARRANYLRIKNNLYDELYLSGVWSGENRLDVEAKWIESSVKKLSFSFEADELHIVTENPRLGPTLAGGVETVVPRAVLKK
jgi:CubicO group peptidase (beta-lactamase class C family)